jgi:hypothetical protein
VAADGLRIARIARLAALQFFSGVLVGYLFLDRKTYAGAGAMLVATGPLASAVLLNASAIALVPRLLPGRPLGSPTNFTMPVVFALLLRVSEILWTSPPSAAFRPPEPLLPALIWSKPLVLLALAGLQSAVMTAWILLRGEREVFPLTPPTANR